MSGIPLQDLKHGNATTEITIFPDGEAGEAVDPVTAEKLGTNYDQKDMHRMGKLQELRRNFRFTSIVGYAVILGATYPYALSTAVLSLTNGGTAGAIWMFLIGCIGMATCMLSMAEMASMAPTAGGQYHWVSEFAPKRYQKFLSYIVVFSIFFNTVLLRKLPLMEGIFLIIYVFGFVAVITVLWVMGPRGDPSIVFTKFEDNAGWGNTGLSTLVGILAPVVTLIGSDSACHLSEELKDAAYILPRSMATTAAINYTLGFVMVITFTFTVGDVQSILTTSTGQPYIQLFLNATQSRLGTSILTSLIILLLLFCAINQITTTSRQLFAFARDNGLPFSAFLSRIRPGWDVPLNALVVTFVVVSLASLIPIGSAIAFNILVSLGTVSLLASYFVVIACMMLKRVRGEKLLPSRFSLGRLGIFINGFALAFLGVAFVMLFFPSAPHPTVQTMNWTIMIFCSVIIISLGYYFVIGRHVYVGPVEYTRKDV
ncbi:hypothetical protein H2201_000065 [Coniosporium apollinis]|uniref:Amino acid transporter n=1 Tax=Coniosporium apollinis TaxID=61459 RepID=A0ABQ9P8U1_9PEZI|nr:hypothetical protein H2201_000065 [Coniosporium apollinis]